MARSALAIAVAAACAASASAQCTQISDTRIAELDAAIAANPVTVFGVPNTNCLVKGKEALAAASVCWCL